MSTKTTYTILSFPDDWRCYKLKLCAALSLLDIEYQTDLLFGTDNQTEEFLKWNPTGTLPILKINDGNAQVIWESNAILRFLGRSGLKSEELYGEDDVTTSRIDQWIEFVTHYVEPNVFYLFCHAKNMEEYVEERYKESLKGMERALGILELHFKENSQYLVGDHLTLADLCLIGAMKEPLEFGIDSKMRLRFPRTFRYFRLVVNEPTIKDTLEFKGL